MAQSVADRMQDLQAQVVAHWMTHPDEWVDSHIDWSAGESLTAQQREAFQALGQLIEVKAKASRGEELSEEEKPMAMCRGLSISSGMGTGKDAFCALALLWFMYVFPRSKCPCTGPTGNQIRDALWSEIPKWIRKSKKDTDGKPILSKVFTVQSDKVYHNDAGGKEWYAVFRTINTKAGPEEQAETLRGKHEDFMLFVVDEATGVPEPVFKPIEAGLTGQLNLVLMIFNPTRSKGFARESHRKDRQYWVTRVWDAEQSEITNKDNIRALAQKYGRESNYFKINVKGIFPQTDTHTLILYDWIMEAVSREIVPLPNDPTILSVDVGDNIDKNIIVARKSGDARIVSRTQEKNKMRLVGWVLSAIESEEAAAVLVDVIGVGSGVFWRLKELGKNAFAIDAKRSAADEQHFYSLRDEYYWRMREAFEEGALSIEDDPELIGQLAEITYDDSVMRQGRSVIKVESKKDLKRRIGHSPDEMDALAMTFAFPDRVFRREEDEEDDYDEPAEKAGRRKNQWMVA